MKKVLLFAIAIAGLSVSSSMQAYGCGCRNNTSRAVNFTVDYSGNAKTIYVAAGSKGNIDTGLWCPKYIMVADTNGRSIAEFHYRPINHCAPKTITLNEDEYGNITASSIPAAN